MQIVSDTSTVFLVWRTRGQCRPDYCVPSLVGTTPPCVLVLLQLARSRPVSASVVETSFGDQISAHPTNLALMYLFRCNCKFKHDVLTSTWNRHHAAQMIMFIMKNQIRSNKGLSRDLIYCTCICNQTKFMYHCLLDYRTTTLRVRW